MLVLLEDRAAGRSNYTGWDADTAFSALGVDRVAFDMVNGNAQGFSFEDSAGRHVTLNPAAKYPARTLLHELAHLMLGHCRNGDPTHRGVAEFEAETVAYTEDNITRVFAAVNKILTAGRVHADVAEAVAA
jgi:IrrE N-terminal-like domain